MKTYIERIPIVKKIIGDYACYPDTMRNARHFEVIMLDPSSGAEYEAYKPKTEVHLIQKINKMREQRGYKYPTDEELVELWELIQEYGSFKYNEGTDDEIMSNAGEAL
jgi:hypothetical protein